MTEQEIIELERLADARTVDADVRAGLHRPAAACLIARMDAADLRNAARRFQDERDEAVRRQDNAELELERELERFEDRLDAYREAADQAAAYARELRDAQDIGPDRTRLDFHRDRLVTAARAYERTARS